MFFCFVLDSQCVRTRVFVCTGTNATGLRAFKYFLITNVVSIFNTGGKVVSI